MLSPGIITDTMRLSSRSKNGQFSASAARLIGNRVKTKRKTWIIVDCWQLRKYQINEVVHEKHVWGLKQGQDQWNKGQHFVIHIVKTNFRFILTNQSVIRVYKCKLFANFEWPQINIKLPFRENKKGTCIRKFVFRKWRWMYRELLSPILLE